LPQLSIGKRVGGPTVKSPNRVPDQSTRQSTIYNCDSCGSAGDGEGHPSGKAPTSEAILDDICVGKNLSALATSKKIFSQIIDNIPSKKLFVQKGNNTRTDGGALHVALRSATALPSADFSCALENRVDSRFYLTLIFGDTLIPALIDCGSTKTYAGPDVIPLLGDLRSTDATMVSANNTVSRVFGEKVVQYHFGKRSLNLKVNALEAFGYSYVLGLDFLEGSKSIVDFAGGTLRLPGGSVYRVSLSDRCKRNDFVRTSVVHDQLGSISACDSRYSMRLSIGGKMVNALVDSGATRSYIGKVFEDSLASSCRKSDAMIVTANGTTEPVRGELDIAFRIGYLRRTLAVRLAPTIDYDFILGIDFLRAFGFQIDFGSAKWKIPGQPFVRFSRDVSLVDPVIDVRGKCAGLLHADDSQKVIIDGLIAQHMKEPTETLGATNLSQHVIDVQGHAPIRQNSRRYSPKVLAGARESVDKLLREGIIERASSPWCSPPVLVPKKDGTYRFCVDYRKVNDVTRKNAHPLPNIDSILDRLRNARYISKVDMSQAFHQIVVHPDSRDITAFSVPGMGQFRYRRMPYGLTNAPATYQEAMDRFVRERLPPEASDVLFVYLDDFCLVTETFEEHVKWLRILLRAIDEANLQINFDKSEFCCSEVKYLGFVVDASGLHTDSDKVQAISDYPAPTTVRQLRRFLGMIGWYGRFLKDFARDKVPLCQLLKKDVPWSWGTEQQGAFEKLKRDLCTAPVLVRPDFNRRFSLHCDASDYAIGSTLMQKDDDGHEHPIVFINKVLSSAERKWTTTEKECFAVIWSLHKLRPYLEGYAFDVVTDHSSLTWLKSMKDPRGRLGRWAMQLLAYDINVVHRPGSQNVVPDALSRAYETQLAALGDVQTRDQWYLTQLDKVRKNPNRYPDYGIKQENLFIHRPNSRIDPVLRDLNAWKLVVPEELRSQVLSEAHDSPQAGHCGRDKSYELLSRYYYWPGMQVDCAKYVKSCLVCQRNKPVQSGPQGLMREREYDEPWTQICADVMGPLPPSSNRYRYVLVVQDLVTTYVVLRPLREANGSQITRTLEESVFFVFGRPKLVHTDNGTEFCNERLRGVLDGLGIRHTTIPPYHAQANPAERVNRSLKRMIRSYLGDSHRKWDEHIAEFAFALNSAEHDSTRFSPYFLTFGRHPRAQVSLLDRVNDVGPVRLSDERTWEDRITRLSAFHDLIKRYLYDASSRQARYYNRGRRDIRYSVGDLVMRKEHYLSKGDRNFAAKLAPVFSGPYKIVEVLSPQVYRLELPSTRKVSKAHVRFLKSYVPPRSASG